MQMNNFSFLPHSILRSHTQSHTHTHAHTGGTQTNQERRGWMRERKINTKTYLSNGAVEAEDFIFGGILIIYKKQQGKHQTKANTK